VPRAFENPLAPVLAPEQNSLSKVAPDLHDGTACGAHPQAMQALTQEHRRLAELCF
jgi:hypothetical protein